MTKVGSTSSHSRQAASTTSETPSGRPGSSISDDFEGVENSSIIPRSRRLTAKNLSKLQQQQQQNTPQGSSATRSLGAEVVFEERTRSTVASSRSVKESPFLDNNGLIEYHGPRPTDRKTSQQKALEKVPSTVANLAGAGIAAGVVKAAINIPHVGFAQVAGATLGPLAALDMAAGAFGTWRSLGRIQEQQKQFLNSLSAEQLNAWLQNQHLSLSYQEKVKNYKNLSQEHKNLLLEMHGFGKRITWREKLGRVIFENVIPSITGFVTAGAALGASLLSAIVTFGAASPAVVGTAIASSAVYMAASKATSWATKKIGDAIWGSRRKSLPELLMERIKGEQPPKQPKSYPGTPAASEAGDSNYLNLETGSGKKEPSEAESWETESYGTHFSPSDSGASTSNTARRSENNGGEPEQPPKGDNPPPPGPRFEVDTGGLPPQEKARGVFGPTATQPPEETSDSILKAIGALPGIRQNAKPDAFQKRIKLLQVHLKQLAELPAGSVTQSQKDTILGTLDQLKRRLETEKTAWEKQQKSEANAERRVQRNQAKANRRFTQKAVTPSPSTQNTPAPTPVAQQESEGEIWGSLLGSVAALFATMNALKSKNKP